MFWNLSLVTSISKHYLPFSIINGFVIKKLLLKKEAVYPIYKTEHSLYLLAEMLLRPILSGVQLQPFTMGAKLEKVWERQLKEKKASKLSLDMSYIPNYPPTLSFSVFHISTWPFLDTGCLNIWSQSQLRVHFSSFFACVSRFPQPACKGSTSLWPAEACRESRGGVNLMTVSREAIRQAGRLAQR